MIQVLRLMLTNVFLITGDKAILVDTGGPKDGARIISFLHDHQLDVRDLSLILHTHGHWDHAGCSAQFKAMTHAPIAIHWADADHLRLGVNGRLQPTNITGRWLLPYLDRPYAPVEPDILFDEEMSLTGFGVDARILFTPGHTAGSISILTGEREMIVGDLLMGGFWGGWLAPGWPGLHYYADNLPQLHASIQKVLAMAPRIIHPSHGGPLDPRTVAERFPLHPPG